MTLQGYIDAVSEVHELCFAGPPWRWISLKTYGELCRRSEYAAWLYACGSCANDFIISVNSLESLGGIAIVNELLN